MNTQEAQQEEHNCNNFGVYRNTKDNISVVCFKCNKILKFQWKSVYKRIISVFTFN